MRVSPLRRWAVAAGSPAGEPRRAAPAGSQDPEDPTPASPSRPPIPPPAKYPLRRRSSSSPKGEIFRRESDFTNDGTRDAVGPEVDHLYPAAGTFKADLPASARTGEDRREIHTITVAPESARLRPPAATSLPAAPRHRGADRAVRAPDNSRPARRPASRHGVRRPRSDLRVGPDGDGTSRDTGQQSFVAHTFPSLRRSTQACGSPTRPGDGAADKAPARRGAAGGGRRPHQRDMKLANRRRSWRGRSPTPERDRHFLWTFEDKGKTTGGHTLGGYAYAKDEFVTKTRRCAHVQEGRPHRVQRRGAPGRRRRDRVEGDRQVDPNGRKDSIIAIQAVGRPAAGYTPPSATRRRARRSSRRGSTATASTRLPPAAGMQGDHLRPQAQRREGLEGRRRRAVGKGQEEIEHKFAQPGKAKSRSPSDRDLAREGVGPDPHRRVRHRRQHRGPSGPRV